MNIKQTLLALCLLAPVANDATAQVTPTFYKGDHLLTAAYGVPNVVGRSLYYFQNDKFQAFGPMYFRYEYGITSTVGLGFQASFCNFSYAYKNQNTGGQELDKGAASDFQLFGTYHFGELMPVKNLDLYGYFGIGMWYVKLNSRARPNTVINDGNLHLAIKGGARYYFTPNVAGVAQIGFDKMSIFDVGLTIRLTAF